MIEKKLWIVPANREPQSVRLLMSVTNEICSEKLFLKGCIDLP